MDESFRSTLADVARALRVEAEAEARTPQELLRRARARLRLGRDAEARADFEASRAEAGDEAAIELAFLDVRSRRRVQHARDEAARIAREAARGTTLEARALHVLGLAEGELRRGNEAADALLLARERCRELGDGLALAQVQDTLGSLFAAQGQVDLAASHYALSLVGKLRAGDVAGIALTLGNLGRLHLRTGRHDDALDCFRLDLELARELGDERGVARMHEDLGRALLGLERHDQAQVELLRALELATARDDHDLVVFARVDLAHAALALHDVEAAAEHVERAESALRDPPDAFLRALVLAARARVLAASGSDGATELLETALERFRALDLPDHEVQAALALAEAHLARGRRGDAEASVRRALELARRDGHARHLPPVREAMARLALVESLVDERSRLGVPGERPPSVDGYQLLARVGAGRYGEVWRAYDPQRGRIVAVKRFTLDGLFAPAHREEVLASARTELAAASRLRHPSIARVFALGTDSTDATYVVQEYVDGPTLRSRVRPGRREKLAVVLATAGRIARALETLHGAGVVHRDLKPENVILRVPDGAPVLIDFGLAHLAGGARGDRTVRGSPAYMSPEQARGTAIDGATDAYALGVLMYEWLAGFRPLTLEELDLDAQLATIQRLAPHPLAYARPDLEPECAALVDGLLAKEAADRPSVAVVAECCEAWSR